ncbi:STAS domain-containing protein [Streptomyces sp. NPDC048566]|uniref:STAS domain-containing protein n=1 Tax=Streptomyces sp. NPDC048566 TaxID=3365569 RepID=UPI00371525F7
MTHLILSTHHHAAGSVIELTGELDFHSADQVRAQLAGLVLPPGGQLVLDLGGITFCDSTGITVLIAARNCALATGAGIALAAVPKAVSRVFRMVGLDQVFPSHATVQAAQAAWQPTG